MIHVSYNYKLKLPQPIDEWLSQVINDWIWDKYTKVVANRFAITMKNLGHIISIVCAEPLLEPMRSWQFWFLEY